MIAEEIIKQLQDKGFEAYIVGGAVRDMLMGLKPKDKDVVTNAEPEELEEIFINQEFKTFGKSFFVSFIDGIEVATFRADNYHGLNDKNVKITKISTLEEDVSRRDFTVNAIAFDPIKDKIYDFVNGQKDLENKVIKFVGDSTHRIFEDPNRIIRACRFLAKIDGTFDINTFDSLVRFSHYVDSCISRERIRLEILKAMEIQKASIFFKSLHDIGALQYILPSLEDCWNHKHGPHHIEDIFYHNMMSGDSVSTRFPLLKLTSYLHDVGKPIACDINPRTKDIWFKGHDDCGADEVKNELENLRFSNDEIHFISNLIRLHMRISLSRLTPKAVRKTLQMLHDTRINYKDLLRLAVSDRRGNYKTSRYYGLREIYELLRVFKAELDRKNPVSSFSNLALDGYEIMQITGLKPGKEIGKILKFLLDKVIENPDLNSKENLQELVLQIRFEGKNNENSQH